MVNSHCYMCYINKFRLSVHRLLLSSFILLSFCYFKVRGVKILFVFNALYFAQSPCNFLPLVHLSLNTECCYISLPLCHSLPSRSICLLLTSSSQLRNTVVGPKITALLPKGEKLHCCKLHQCEISPPLQLSTPSSVKPFMKPIPRSSFLQLLLFSFPFYFFCFSEWSYIFIPGLSVWRNMEQWVMTITLISPDWFSCILA